MTNDIKNISYDELYYMICEKNEDAEEILFRKVEHYLGWICYAKTNDFLRHEDVMSYGWQGYIEAFRGYNEYSTTTFKSFLHHCVDRRLIDVQRKRNKKTLKAHMSSLLMSEEKVQYAVEVRNTSSVTNTRLYFREFWQELSQEEQQLFSDYAEGITISMLAEEHGISENMVYKKIRNLRVKMKDTLLN